jgi:hypothetical protein
VRSVIETVREVEKMGGKMMVEMTRETQYRESDGI